MIFTDRVLIYESNTTSDATLWCEKNLKPFEWAVEFFDNNDCFYFTNRNVCVMFMFMFGGKHIPVPEKNYV